MTRKMHLLAASAAIAAITIAPTSAQAIVVYDPTNHAQNVLQAARALEQINNQIQSLQNEAQGLLNQARNLASLPFSALDRLKQSVQATQSLLAQAQGIAHKVADIDQAFQSTYAPASPSLSHAQMVAGAEARWRQSVQALQDTLKVQAGVVGNLEIGRGAMSDLVTASQSATGALQATQAGNQLLALQAQILTDLAASAAAHGRAQALEAAQRVAAQDLGRENLRRFLSSGDGYQAVTVTMFHR